IVFGNADPIKGTDFWWRRLGHPSPLHHLLAAVGMKEDEAGERQLDQGRVWRRKVSPKTFSDPDVARTAYVPLVDRGLKAAGIERGLEIPGGFILRRGPFVIAHASTRPLDLPGRLIDIFEPNLPLHDGVHLEVGQSGLYRDVSNVFDRKEDASVRVLHTTHRLVEEVHADGVLRMRVRGPAETPAVVRLHAPKGIRTIDARTAQGDVVAVEQHSDGATLLLRFANDPDGVTLRIE
ncbi:MAG: hypothetical protein ACC645_13270, partial [Pirellulales bacterium]